MSQFRRRYFLTIVTVALGGTLPAPIQLRADRVIE